MVAVKLLTALAVSTLVSAAPHPITPRQTSSPFYLQTRVLSGDATKDGLFAVAYHSYAGGNDVALLPNSSTSPATKGFLNGTYVQFDLSQGDVYPYGLYLNNLDGDSYWDEWNAVGINTGYGENSTGIANGFFLNATGLHANREDFGGWLACDWARSVPQLFWYESYVDVSEGKIPSSCAVVDLCQVPA